MKLRRVVAAVTAAAVFAATVPAVAQTDANVTVVLKSGAKYRGELVEEVPNDHVTIKLVTGEVKRFAWDEIDRAPPPVVVSAPAAPEPSGPLVVIESEQPLSLERAHAHGDVVCSAPCKMRVEPGEYRLVGTGLRSSAPFSLGGNSTLKVEASLGKPGPYIAGMTFGFIGLGLGFVSVLAAVSVESPLKCDETRSTPGQSQCEPDTSAVDGFLIVAGVAIAISVLGFAFAASNSNNVRVGGREIASRKSGPTIALTPRGIVF